MSDSPYCRNAGYLVGGTYTVPADPHVYYPEERWPIIGCNRIFCDQCGNMVRSWGSYMLTRGVHALSRADHEQLFRTSDPASAPLLKPASKYRTYACLCWADSVTGSWDLGRGYMEFDHWACAGHPAKSDP